jgi:hypothetical protein
MELLLRLAVSHAVLAGSESHAFNFIGGRSVFWMNANFSEEYVASAFKAELEVIGWGW